MRSAFWTTRKFIPPSYSSRVRVFFWRKFTRSHFWTTRFWRRAVLPVCVCDENDFFYYEILWEAFFRLRQNEFLYYLLTHSIFFLTKFYKKRFCFWRNFMRSVFCSTRKRNFALLLDEFDFFSDGILREAVLPFRVFDVLTFFSEEFWRIDVLYGMAITKSKMSWALFVCIVRMSWAFSTSPTNPNPCSPSEVFHRVS